MIWSLKSPTAPWGILLLLQFFRWPFWGIHRSVCSITWSNAKTPFRMSSMPSTGDDRSDSAVASSHIPKSHPLSSSFIHFPFVKVFAVAKCNLDRKVAFSNPEIIYQLKAGATLGHTGSLTFTDPIAKLSGCPFRLDQFGSKAPGIFTVQVPGVRTWIKVKVHLLLWLYSFNQFSSILLIYHIGKNSTILSNNKRRFPVLLLLPPSSVPTATQRNQRSCKNFRLLEITACRRRVTELRRQHFLDTEPALALLNQLNMDLGWSWIGQGSRGEVYEIRFMNLKSQQI